MLNSLLIKNFRAFEHLEIPSLARVNLITGKNDTGKTSLLEAMNLYANCGFLNVIKEMLTSRNELPANGFEEQAYSSLFHQRKFDFDRPTPVIIGDEQRQLSIAYAKKIDELNIGDADGFYIRLTLNNKFVAAFHINGMGIRNQHFSTWNCQFVKSAQQISLSHDNNLATLWDKQSLSDNGDHVLEALSILEPIGKLAFVVNDPSNQRKPFVRLKSGEQLPLRNFGDGINRVLHIAIALVNCENGFLLIDEFENGLHYSVQEKLWQLIFSVAEKLNVQVFATTHSNDAVKSFVDVISSESHRGRGQVIYLQHKGGNIRAVDFNLQQVQTAVEHDLELR